MPGTATENSALELRRVSAIRYVTALREGGSLPGLVEGDDDGTWVVKFSGAGQGPGALVSEVVGGELARRIGLPVPELVAADVAPELGHAEPDPEIQELIEASPGLNLGMDFLPGSLPFALSPAPPICSSRESHAMRACFSPAVAVDGDDDSEGQQVRTADAHAVAAVEEALQFGGCFPDLADAARTAFHVGRLQGLYRINDHQLGFQFPDLLEDGLGIGFGEQVKIIVPDADAFGPHFYLLFAFFSADV